MANTAATTASAMNSTRIAALWSGLVVERTSVTRRIGPNSPVAPAARSSVPNGVCSSPASRSIGISVPIAVVANAEPVKTSESTTPASASSPPSP